MCPGRAFLQALQEAAALADAAAVLDQRRQPAGESFVEARNRVGGVVLQFPDIDHASSTGRYVHIFAAQRHDIDDLNVLLFIDLA